MNLSRSIAVAAALAWVPGVLAAVPAEAATCPTGVLCVYPQSNFRGTVTRYTPRDLIDGYRSGDGSRPFTAIVGSGSAQNRIGFTVTFATRESKVCITRPCPQYAASESVPNGADRPVFNRRHDLVRRGL
ncbi:peptidase inhibitor family I36 protein [Actinomadura scrupuli]|uniref:peptidase inhibitor family I36 protein n=1 Tax=Actinomadura scrupuli TaxID=559629 RepID=UPI003D999168